MQLVSAAVCFEPHCYEVYTYKEGDSAVFKNGIYAKSNVTDPNIVSMYAAGPVWVVFGDGHWVEMGAVKGWNVLECGHVFSTQFYIYWNSSSGGHCELLGSVTSYGNHTYRIYDLEKDNDWEFELDGARKKSNLSMGHSSGKLEAGGENVNASAGINGMSGLFTDLFYITTYSGSESYTSTRWADHYCSDNNDFYWIDEITNSSFSYGYGSGSEGNSCG